MFGIGVSDLLFHLDDIAVEFLVDCLVLLYVVVGVSLGTLHLSLDVIYLLLLCLGVGAVSQLLDQEHVFIPDLDDATLQLVLFGL